MYLDEADERVESCILDIDGNGEEFTDTTSGDDSPGSEDDSKLSLLPILNIYEPLQIAKKQIIFSNLGNCNR